jgi:4-amino-4-deoxy-L-arabinose transferase-like glycosyltransferase
MKTQKQKKDSKSAGLLSRLSFLSRPGKGMLYTSLIIFFAAFAIRAVIWQQSQDTILTHAHRWDQSDMHFFDTWAKSLANGDWLNKKGLHPYHFWHDSLAAMYFQSHPQDTLAFQKRAGELRHIHPDMDMRKALIYDWYGGPVFHQEPLYVYLVALTYKVFGPDVRGVFFWQMLLGALSSVLLFWIGRRWFGYRLGLLAAALGLLCGPLVFFDFVLLRSSLSVFFILGILYLFSRLLDEKTPWLYGLFGFLSALSILNYSYFAILLAGTWFLHAVMNYKQWKEYMRPYAFLLAGLVIPFLPVMIRNAMLDLPLMSIASNGGITFITANAKITDPYSPFFIDYSTLHNVMASTGGETWASIKETLRTHPDIASYLALVWLKIKGIFAPFEIPNNINYYLVRRFVPAFQYLPVGQFLLAPLGITGLLALLFSRMSVGLPFLLFWGIALFPMLYFSGLARHRVPLLALEILTASYLFAFFRDQWLANKKWLLLASVALAAGLTFWVGTNDVPNRTRYDYFEYRFTYDSIYKPAILEYENKQDWTAVLKTTQKLIDARPEYLDALLRELDVQDHRQPDVVGLYADFYKMHGYALQKNQRDAEGKVFIEKADILRQRSETMKTYFSK